MRFLADSVVDKVERCRGMARLWQSTPNPNQLKHTTRKKQDKAMDVAGREFNPNRTPLRKTSTKSDPRAAITKFKQTKLTFSKQIKNEHILPITSLVKLKVDQIGQNCSKSRLSVEGCRGGGEVIRNKRKRKVDEFGTEPNLHKRQNRGATLSTFTAAVE